jgi:glycosidase
MRSLPLLLILLLCTCVRAQSIDRVEPPNWWIGFENTALELLVYGKDISHLRAKIEHPGVTVKSVITTDNPNYLFVTLDVEPETKAGTFPIIFHDRDKEVLRWNYQLMARKTGAKDIAGYDNSDVLYLITPDRFANGDPSNDEVDGMKDTLNRNFGGGRHGGDIAGMSNSLDYIADMGFTAVWVNPVLENDMEEYSYHGYSTTDFYEVDARYGTNESYQKLGVDAGAKGVKMIMDMILNHCGSNHWFVLDPPTDDWINNGGEYINTSHKRTTVQDVHASNYDKKMFSDGWFVSTMPDLNQRNPLMATYLIQNSIWWIEYAGLAGIRMDTYPYPDADFMADWTCAVMSEYPHFSIVGEEWSSSPAIVSYWQAGKVNHDGYTSCLPGLMDFPVQEAMRKSLTEKPSWGDDWTPLYEMMAHDFLYADHNALVVFPDNHDMARVFTQVNHDADLWRLALAFVLTTRGTPQVYYGTEILMDSRENPGDHGLIRSDFPGGWAADTTSAFTGKGLSDEQSSAQAWLKKLLNWRKSSDVIHHGKLMQFAPNDQAYVYFRYTETSKVMVVLNKNEDSVTLPMMVFDEMLKGEASLTDILTGERSAIGETLVVEGKRAYIFEVR